MTDYHKALAAAREAHTYVKHLGMTRAEAALGDLLAALDAARGQAVATVQPITSLGGETRKVIIGKAEVIDALPVGTAVYLAPQQPAALAVQDAAALVQKWREQANAALRRSGTWNGDDMADRIERMADELAAMLAAAARKGGES